jgi:multicomponent Na+:H+ antiporter subunit E
MLSWFVSIPVWLLYLVLSGNYEPRNMVAGLIIALGVTALIRPQARKVELRRLPGALLALVRYIFLLAYDLIISGFQVARIVLSPTLPISPGIVAIPTDCRSELSIALSAHAISVSPGELVIEIDDGGMMYTHVLDATRKSKYIREAQQVREQLLGKIFI